MKRTGLKIASWLGVEMALVSDKEKALSALGGFLAILLLITLSEKALPGASLPVIASMGASAVLLFGVPHGPLSQPWPVFAGHGLSAVIGVICAHYIASPVIAAACAVGLSIGAMHQLRCIHPPGGATALTAVLGGPAIHKLGFIFVFLPVLANALGMILIAVFFNSFFSWRRYPAILSRSRFEVPEETPAIEPAHPSHEEVLAALRSLDSFIDISEEDLIRLTEALAKREGNSGREQKTLGTLIEQGPEGLARRPEEA